MNTTVSTRARPRFLAGLAAGFAPFPLRHGAQAQTGAPDIVVIVLNDARDGDEIALPQTMARLRDGGTTFPNFFLTTPLCCPSRATILTGMYAHNTNVYQNSAGKRGGWKGFARNGNRGRSTGVLLQNAGYHTVAVGAYLNGNQPGRGRELGWDVGPVAKRKQRRKKKKGRKNRNRNRGSQGDARVAAAATAAVEEAPLDQPLYLHIGFGTPHVPLKPIPPYAGQYAGAQVERDPSFNEVDMSDKPAYMRSLNRLRPRFQSWLDRHHQQRLECLARLDDEIVRVWDALEARGRIDNTFVFFMTDNGYLLGQHRYYGKHVPYDGSARMPLYAYGPSFDAGTVDERLVGNVDIAPTLVDVAGAEAPEMDGVSLLSSHERDVILLEFLARKVNSMKWPGPRTRISRYSALRSAQHLYVEHRSGARELYDYDADPYEEQNLLAGTPTPQVQAIAESFADRLQTLRNCRGSTCR